MSVTNERYGMFKHLLYRLYEGRLLQEVRGGELLGTSA